MMRQHKSFFFLSVRRTIYPLIAILILMVVAQVGLFYWVQQGVLETNQGELEAGVPDAWVTYISTQNYQFEGFVEGGFIPIVSGIALVLVTALLLWKGNCMTGTQGYTLGRLSLSEPWMFLLQSAHYSLVYLLFWMVQLLSMGGLWLLFVAGAPEGAVTNQTLYLATYRSNFFHGLLPLNGVAILVRNVALVVGLGVVTARASLYRKSYPAVVVLLAIVLIWFPISIGWGAWAIVVFLGALALGGTGVVFLLVGRDES